MSTSRGAGKADAARSVAKLMARAESLEKGGDQQKAIAIYGEAAKAASSPSEARPPLRRQVRILIQQGDQAAAILAMKRLRKVGRPGPADHRRLFRALHAAGRSSLVARYLDLLRSRPIKASGWHRAVLAYWSEGCATELEALAGAHPKGVDAGFEFLRSMAEISVEHREAGPAAAALGAAHLLKPADPVLLLDLCRAFQTLGDHARTLQTAERLLALAPDHAEARRLFQAAKASSAAAGLDENLPAQLKAFRALRKVAELRPADYRRMFRLLGALRGDELIERYADRVALRPPSEDEWSRCFLVLWAACRRGALKALLADRPADLKSATSLVEACAANSTRNSDPVMARSLLDAIAGWGADPDRICLHRARLSLQEGRFAEAMTLAGSIASESSDFQAAVSLKKRAAEAELYQIADRLGVDAVGSALVALDRLESVVGSTPLLKHIRSAVLAWKESPRQAAPKVDRSLGLSGRLLGAAARSRPAELAEDFEIGEERTTGRLTGAAAARMRTQELAENFETGGGRSAGRLTGAAARSASRAAPGGPTNSPKATNPKPTPDAAKMASAAIRILENPSQADVLTLYGALADVQSRLSDGRTRNLVEGALAETLRRLDEIDLQSRAQVEDGLQQLAFQSPIFINSLAAYFERTARPERAIHVLKAAPLRHFDSRGWVRALEIALKSGDPVGAADFGRRAAERSGSSGAARASALLLAHGLEDEAIAIWDHADQDRPLKVGLGLIRTLRAAARYDELFEVGINILRTALPLSSLEAADQILLVGIVRMIVRSVFTARRYDALHQIDPELESDLDPRFALDVWVAGMLKSARLDREAALEAFHGAIDFAALHPELPLDIRGEIAALNLSYNLYGEARRVAPLVESMPSAAQNHYSRTFQLLQEVNDFCGDAEHYPECLIDIILDEVAQEPLAYIPIAGHVATVTASLAHGGGERQAITIVQSLCDEPRVKQQTLYVRSVEGPLGFFLPIAQSLPIDVVVYGDNWKTPTDLDHVLPQLADRPKLKRAIDLLPHSIREELSRLVALMFKSRPSVVHIRQDIYAPALAAAIIGVPISFIHRGSLSRDNWSHTNLEKEITLRPLRHAYRQLLDRTSFFMVNNSGVGKDSDIAWLNCPDESRVQVVSNAVDFDGLGPIRGPELDLRDRLGIPQAAPIVGGVFRMEAVKRPLLWIEIASLVAKSKPDAHFIICGDGKMADLVRSYAEAEGISDRVHLPGAVTGVGDWYQIMDVLLLTSDREGLPNVLIESQHFSVPVVSSDVGGARETMLPGVTGYLVDADAGAEAFADCLVRILEDPDWLRRARATAADFVHSKFGATTAVEKLVKLYGLSDE